MAADWCPVDMIASILEKRPQGINLANLDGETPLPLALRPDLLSYNSEQVVFLLGHGTNPEACPTERQRAVLAYVQESKPTIEIDELIRSLEMTPTEIESGE